MRNALHRPLLIALALLPALCRAQALPAVTPPPATAPAVMIPPPPDLPLSVSAGWDNPNPAPGTFATLGMTFTNPAPASVPGPPLSYGAGVSVPYTSAAGPGGPYSAIITVPVLTVAAPTLPATKHVGPVVIPLPAWLVPQPFPAAYSLTTTPTGYTVTLPAFDLAGGGNGRQAAVRVRVQPGG